MFGEMITLVNAHQVAMEIYKVRQFPSENPDALKHTLSASNKFRDCSTPSSTWMSRLFTTSTSRVSRATTVPTKHKTDLKLIENQLRIKIEMEK